jgi:hypothetical protein
MYCVCISKSSVQNSLLDIEKTLNFVTFEEFLTHPRMHHTSCKMLRYLNTVRTLSKLPRMMPSTNRSNKYEMRMVDLCKLIALSRVEAQYCNWRQMTLTLSPQVQM